MNRPECIGRIEEAIEAGPTPGPWRWWTSNSYRRLSSDATGHDGDVLHGTIQRSDNHPDVQASQQTMDYIAAANPSALKELLAYVRELEKDAGRYRWLRAQDWFSGPLCVLREPKRVLTSGNGLGADCPSHSRLDEAIDAALSSTLLPDDAPQLSMSMFASQDDYKAAIASQSKDKA